MAASACQKSLFDKLVDGGVSPPPLPPPQRTGTSAKRSFRQRRQESIGFWRAGRACAKRSSATAFQILLESFGFRSQNLQGSDFSGKNQLRGRRTRRRPRLKCERAPALSRSPWGFSTVSSGHFGRRWPLFWLGGGSNDSHNSDTLFPEQRIQLICVFLNPLPRIRVFVRSPDSYTCVPSDTGIRTRAFWRESACLPGGHAAALLRVTSLSMTMPRMMSRMPTPLPNDSEWKNKRSMRMPVAIWPISMKIVA